MNPKNLIALGLLAILTVLALEWFNENVAPEIAGVLPADVRTNPWVGRALGGAAILAAVTVTAFVLRKVKLPARVPGT